MEKPLGTPQHAGRRVPGAGRATDATYTVNDDTGANPVIIDQTQGEGFWTLLGSYSYTASQEYTVILSDQANGSVSADAIYVVETPAPEPPAPPDAVSWVPDIPAAADYEVFIKYTADASRDTAASYTVNHATGSTTVPIDQTQNGGVWVSMGSFTFNAGTSGSVSVEASTEGTVSADAVRFVAESAPPGQIAYILSDHLGTPQKLVDASKAIVWDRVQTPFGITYSETTAPARETNVRFPGQWADAETGLHYNYFRDYDPTLGRYIESDPIGLGGGLNAFGYVGGNPISYADRRGLFRAPRGGFPGSGVNAGRGGIGRIAIRGGAKVAARVGRACIVLVAADGPLPLGDAVCAGLAVGATAYVVYHMFDDDDGCRVGRDAGPVASAGPGAGTGAGSSGSPANDNSPSSRSGNQDDDDDNDECQLLYAEIDGAVRSLQKRNRELIEDKLGLPLSGTFSIEGHQQAFRQDQRYLRRLLNAAIAKGCRNYRGDAWGWATMPAPFPQ